MLAAFTFLTFLVTSSGLDDAAGKTGMVLLTTAFSFTGPMTGAICRGMQGCCLETSLVLTGWTAPFLLLTIGAQFLRWPRTNLSRFFRILLWILGWGAWFFGGFISFGHALS